MCLLCNPKIYRDLTPEEQAEQAFSFWEEANLRKSADLDHAELIFNSMVAQGSMPARYIEKYQSIKENEGQADKEPGHKEDTKEENIKIKGVTNLSLEPADDDLSWLEHFVDYPSVDLRVKANPSTPLKYSQQNYDDQKNSMDKWKESKL